MTKNIEWPLKQSSTSIQLRFNMFQHSLKGGGGGGGVANGFTIAVHQNGTDVEANFEADCPGREVFL